jgi:hypothetical protein
MATVQTNPRSGEVEIYNNDGLLQWSGKPLGHRARAALSIKGSDDAIVLVDPDAVMKCRFQNLLRIAHDGSVQWRADLPGRENEDTYVSVQWVGTELMANTWSAYRVRIDVGDGRILESTFTK